MVNYVAEVERCGMEKLTKQGNPSWNGDMRYRGDKNADGFDVSVRRCGNGSRNGDLVEKCGGIQAGRNVGDDGMVHGRGELVFKVFEESWNGISTPVPPRLPLYAVLDASNRWQADQSGGRVGERCVTGSG